MPENRDWRVKVAALRIRKDQVLSSLIQTAYLPAEVPPTVTAKNFASYCRDNYGAVKLYKPSTPTQYEKFSIPRENGSRRDLAIVHPAAQLRVTALLSENHKKIREIILSSGISLYDSTPDFENFKAFKGVAFRELDRKRSDVARKKPYILNADISRFFYTIYTHSIPWAVLGKEKIKEEILKKKKKKGVGHWSEGLDAALQFCQSRETFGIPVGPDTSRIIAEILLSGVHGENDLALALSQAPGFRLVDDFFIGFDSENDCRNALTALRNSLARFNLQLNDDKTWIRPAREIFMDRWRHELLHTPIPRGDARLQARGIHRLSETALYHSSQLGTGFPVKWAAQKLSKMAFHRRNFALLLSTLLRFSRDFPECMNIVVAFIINNKRFCSAESAMSLIENWVRAIFRSHARHSHDFEVAWALVVCGALKIKVSKSDFGDYAESMCSVAFSILGLLKDHRLLADSLSSFGWRAEVKKSGVNGHHWLMYYESVLRGWTNDRDMVDAVKSHDLMKLLLDNKITFLDDSIFGNVRINLENRRMRRIKYSASLLEAEEINIEESSLGLASI